MDIFTTALTRVVPVPIKRENLKVKKLAKEAASSAVSDDIIGLEDHEPYHIKKASPQDSNDEKTPDDDHAEPIEACSVPSDNTGQNVDVFTDDNVDNEPDDKKPHLDIFV